MCLNCSESIQVYRQCNNIITCLYIFFLGGAGTVNVLPEIYIKYVLKGYVKISYLNTTLSAERQKMYELTGLKTKEYTELLEKREKLINQIDEIDQAIEDQTGRSICEVLESSEVQPNLRHAPSERRWPPGSNFYQHTSLLLL